ncbi:MAG: PAS domain S-box protein [Deltaproteobacteria bacterium]|jgi:PAS domain S-box-containing protein|nr:PAS domain S-box protein [Deltaproteobacteria bacterium]
MSKSSKTSLQTATPILEDEIARQERASKPKKRLSANIALQKSQRRFKTIFKAAPIGIAMANPEGYFIEVNRAFAKMLGYRKAEMTGLTFVDITHPEDREETQKLSNAVRQGKINSYRSEKRYLKKDGQVVCGIIRATAVKDNQGQIQYWLGLVEDISDRRLAEEALEESEKRYRMLFEHAAEGIMVLDLQSGKFRFANPAICKMLGYTAKELTTMGVKDIYPRKELKRVLRKFSEQIEGEKRLAQNIPCLRKDGTLIYVNINSTRVVLDGVECNVGFFQDITKRVTAEEALRESEEKYRNILTNIEEGYFEVDLAGNLVFFNDACCELIGYPADELVGMNNRQFTSPGTAKKMFKTFNRVYKTGKPAQIAGFEVITKGNVKKHMELSASLIKDSEQKAIGFRGIVRDVTARLKSQKEKERLVSQIQHVQKMESIGTLAGGIAHDFNNLLMGFQGNISLMLLDLEDDHPHVEYLKNMESYVLKGSELTRQILGFARRGKYQVKTTNINELLDKSAEMFSRTKKEITIHKKFQDDLWPVDVDRGQIEQVLLNLFVNAWQAMPAGGEIYIETEGVHLEDDYDKPYEIEPGPHVRISVTDTGVGMDEDIQQKIFEPFFTTKAVGRGTGMGLASAYGIIKNHNGIINVYSEKGHGTTFKIYLPASDKTVPKEKAKAQKLLKGSETILLVDDEHMVIDIGKEILEKLGYTVFTAESGTEALQLFKKNQKKIDLVILDMIMPDMSGRDTFENLKACQADVKVLLSSGYSIDGQATEILNSGCKGFIQKPFSLKQLSRKMREILEEQGETH